nr:transposase [Kosakonia arachidis]
MWPPERRRTPQENIPIIQQTMEPGMTVSPVARLHGINANPIFKWHRPLMKGIL